MFAVSATRVWAGEDSPPSVVAGWIVGLLCFLFCVRYGGSVDTWLVGAQDKTRYDWFFFGNLLPLPDFVQHLWFRELCFICFTLPSMGLLLLLAYPVPHKYNAGGAYGDTASAVGYGIGSIIGTRFLACLNSLPSVPSFSCNVLYSFQPAGIGGGSYHITVPPGGSLSLGGGGYPSTTPCVWSWALRSAWGIVLSMLTMAVLSSLYVHWNGMRMCICTFFRPRLTHASKDLLVSLSSSDHRHLLDSLSDALAAVEAINEMTEHGGTNDNSVVPVARDVKMRGEGVRKRRGNTRDRSESRSHGGGGGGGRLTSHSSGSSGGRSPLHSEHGPPSSNMEATASGSTYGTYESAVPFRYIVSLFVGCMTTFVGPCVVYTFGG